MDFSGYDENVAADLIGSPKSLQLACHFGRTTAKYAIMTVIFSHAVPIDNPMNDSRMNEKEQIMLAIGITTEDGLFVFSTEVFTTDQNELTKIMNKLGGCVCDRILLVEDDVVIDDFVRWDA